jgi:hypothetical protein
LNFELTVALSSINAPKYPDPRSEKYVTSWERRKSVTKTGRTQVGSKDTKTDNLRISLRTDGIK